MCGVLNPGTPFGYVIVLRDVTAQVRLTRRLAYEASHDSLTRLPNRRRFEEMIDGALTSARHSNVVHTVAFIDLDRFKQVNDSLRARGRRRAAAATSRTASRVDVAPERHHGAPGRRRVRVAPARVHAGQRRARRPEDPAVGRIAAGRATTGQTIALSASIGLGAARSLLRRARRRCWPPPIRACYDAKSARRAADVGD